MRENIANQSPMETLSFNGFQRPYADVATDQKAAQTNVSSNVYYGYQPLRVENGPEFMHTEALSKSSIEMDTNQSESRLTNRKRTRDSTESCPEIPKKRRQNEPHHSPGRSPSKTHLEEDLLRETHGCSYYHWVSSSM